MAVKTARPSEDLEVGGVRLDVELLLARHRRLDERLVGFVFIIWSWVRC